MAESLFRVYDADKSGNLDFSEFVQANSVKNLDKPEDKLSWMFDAFDEDEGGTVDAEEVHNIVVGLFGLGGIEEDEDLLSIKEEKRLLVPHHSTRQISPILEQAGSS